MPQRSALLLLVSGCGSSLFESKNGGTQSGPQQDLKKLKPDVTHKPLKTKVRKAKAKLYKPSTVISLDIPPDLVTTTNQTVLDNLEEGKQNKIMVLPEIVGARIVKKDDMYGLEVDTSVESAWETVTRFWALSNVNLVEYNPEAGYDGNRMGRKAAGRGPGCILYRQDVQGHTHLADQTQYEAG